MVKLDFEVVEHIAGIRPTVKDRRPVIGSNTQHPHVKVFNGMGTKGISLAPYFADIFVDHLLLGKEIPLNVSIDRFLK
ncbi:MAG: FAD-dependent oxidoreductase [Saprospiraceae bacterium]